MTFGLASRQAALHGLELAVFVASGSPASSDAPPAKSLDDLAYFSRQRMEFLKRLYSAKHGIYKKSPAPLDGKVHVLGVTPNGEIREYPKTESAAKIVR